LLVDTLNITGGSLLRAKQSLKKFISGSLSPDDLVMILASGGADAFSAQFTADRELLRYSIDRIQYWGNEQSHFTPTLAAGVLREDKDAIELARSILAAEGIAAGGLAGASMVRDIASEVLTQSAAKRDRLVAAVQAAARELAKAPGQRLLFLISDGFSLMDRRGNMDTGDLERAISGAARSGVVIYSVNAKGLEPPPESDGTRRGITGGATIHGILSRYNSAWEKDALDGMNALAKDTGGETFFRTNDTAGALRKSLDQNLVYYALAYYASETRGDTSRRTVSVRVKGKHDYKVRAQKGYLAADLSKPAASKPRSTRERLFDALGEAIPSSAIRISSSAKFLEVESDRAAVSVQVGIEGSRLDYRREAGQSLLNLELAVAAYDRGGKLVTSYTDSIRADIPDDRLEAAKQSGFRYAKRLELGPGLYLVRVGAIEPETGLIGTGIAWVEVPDLSNRRLALSGILLNPGGPNGESRQAAVFRWSPIQSFQAGEALAYYLMAYNIPAENERETVIRTEIYQDQTAVYRSEWKPVAERIVGRDKKGIELGGQLTLPLTRGTYELRVSVRNAKTAEMTVQNALFAVDGGTK
jgi:VWFA-related protein